MAEKNRKWRKKIIELAGDQSQNMVTMLVKVYDGMSGGQNELFSKAEDVADKVHTA